MKYVTITNGSLGFYDTDIHTTIPSGAYEITDADYTMFFSDQGKYTFEAQDSKESQLAAWASEQSRPLS